MKGVFYMEIFSSDFVWTIFINDTICYIISKRGPNVALKAYDVDRCNTLF